MEANMKSLCLLTSACLIFSHFAVAQNGIKSEPFSVVIDVGPAIQQTKSGGGLIEINPGYTLSGRYRAGIQWAWAGFDEHTVNSFTLTLDYYYFQNRKFRLSFGGGYGLYTDANYSSQTSLPPEETIIYQNTGRMGGNLRAGFEWNHLSFRIAWHKAPDLYKYEYNIYYPPGGVSLFKGSYLGLTIGIRIGGGNK